jgi:hypothetical protein
MIHRNSCAAFHSSDFGTRERLIPLQINGVQLWKEPSISNIKTLLKAGIAVPGCHLETSDSLVRKGR